MIVDTTRPADTTTAGIANPLQSVPSMLALRDLRRRVVASGKLAPNASTLTKLLSLDPLAVCRAIRIAQAPINGIAEPIQSIPQLAEKMGKAFVQRLLDVPIVEPENTTRLRKLWLHALATAHAAYALASSARTIDPDRAFMLGLIHDLPQWLQELGRHSSERTSMSVDDFVAEWRLPKLPTTEYTLGDLDPVEFVRSNPDALIPTAERLAEISDFCHPDAGATDRAELLRSTSREALVQAHAIRHDVQRSLDEFGLDFLPAGVTARPHDAGQIRLFEGRWLGNQAQLIVSLLQCSRSSSYLAIVTVGTSAALRYLDFERAYFISWNRVTGRCWVRSKADLSIRQMSRMSIRPTAQEIEILERAIAKESPQLINRPAGGIGLAGATGADSAIVACVNPNYSTPTFLMLDRNLTGRPIDLESDGQNAAALAGTVAILTDNLELRLRQQRAERFAMTDPLTRLTNRGVGILTLEQEMARAKRDPKPLCVLMLDLDEFKDLNDRFGHLAGDHALRVTSNVLRKTLRKSDTVCRYGGEEFLVILPETTQEEASILATRLFIAVEQTGQKENLPLTVSIGLSSLRTDDATTDSIVSRADRALYASKSRGRNRFSVDSD